MVFSDRQTAKTVFRASVRLLATSSLSLIEDYPLSKSPNRSEEKQWSSHQLLTHYISKTQLGKLRRDIRKATRFLIAVEKAPNLDELRDWIRLFDDWHKHIARHHISHQNTQWMYFATAFHYMIDAYLHIFKRFLVNDSMKGHSCHWCKAPLVVPWHELLETVVREFAPNIYIYTALAQAQNTDTDIAELPAQSLEELRELGRVALTS